MTNDVTTNPLRSIEYASHLVSDSETRESNLAIASVIVPFVGPLIAVPVLIGIRGHLPIPQHVFLGAMILIIATGLGLPVAAIIRVCLSNGTRTGIGWALCGLTIALLGIAAITVVVVAG